jgi:ATP-dependent helicase/nuclease subunit A
VHTAKGLQAPVVFLPDTTDTPEVHTPLFWPPQWVDLDVPLWSPRKHADDPLTAKLRLLCEDADMDEYRRLLYVAMTRAEDRLYVCGWCHKGQKDKEPVEGSWYRLVEAGLAGAGEARDFDFTALDPALGWQGPGWRLANPQEAAPVMVTDIPAPPPEAGELPDFARRRAPAEPAPPRPLAPSRPVAGEPAMLSPLGEGDDELRFRRGLLVHRLLELLPDIPADKRRRAAERFLARGVHALDSEARAEIAEETLAVLDDPDFAPLFGAESMAEVPVTGLVQGREGPAAVSGQVDRLALTEDAVMIVDYKTNRPPPVRESEVSPVYLRQMASYAALLRQIYPDKAVRCYLLWTAAPRLMQLSPEALAAHAP